MLPRSRRRALLFAGLLGMGAYAAYRAYTDEEFQRKRRELYERWARTVESLYKYGEALVTGAEILSVLARDMLAFLTSETDELPRSLGQLAKLLR